MKKAQNATRALHLALVATVLGCSSGPSSGQVQAPVSSDSSAPPADAPDESVRSGETEGKDLEIEENETDSPGDSVSMNGAGAERPLPEGTKVLHVGDSFAGALGLPLGELFEAAGLRSVLKHTDSSYLTDWAWDGSLQKYLWKYNPDLVIVTLGANELEIAQPEQREKTVKKIISTIGDRPCVWIAIPLWDGPKNGLLEVIREHSKPCVFMDTNALFDPATMPRIHDGIHPTTSARKKWASDVLEWLKTHRNPTPGKPWTLEE